VSLRWPAPYIAFGVACSVGCSGNVTPRGGLMLVFGTDGSLEPDVLEVRLRSGDGSKQYHSKRYGVRGLHRPETIAVQSNDDAKASVTIDASVWRNHVDGGASGPLDVRHYEITGVPTDRVAELDIVFSASCAAATCSSGTTCNAAGQCTTSRISATNLLTFPADAGAFDKPRDAGHETTSDVNLRDAEAPDASDAGRECVFLSARCLGKQPQICERDGHWQNDTACNPGVTHCRGVRCQPVPPSCAAPLAEGTQVDCALGRSEDCCGSYEVRGDNFLQNYDADKNTDKSHRATISTFYLDAFEVTVGRFRRFVSAVVDGWRPPNGDGKHRHLRDGAGLMDIVDGTATFEAGWQEAWNAELPSTRPDWDSALACETDGTWTPSPDGNERLPINCIDWYTAYAFCIWDGGFLPSQAEWNYAAAGGREQRIFAWGNKAPERNTDLAIWGCLYGAGCTAPGGLVNIAPVGFARAGDGRWGQSDLTGSMWERVLDLNRTPLPSDCYDCANTALGAQRMIRGGGFNTGIDYLYVSFAFRSPEDLRLIHTGVRCARSP
jgi:formylglycine-generating enzyme